MPETNLRRLPFARRANEAVDRALSEAEQALMTRVAARKLGELLDILHIDHLNDHNTRDTPLRVARMFVEEIMRGRFADPPVLTAFDNIQAFDQRIITGPIDIRSTCAHHLMPVYGEAFIGVLPSVAGSIIMISKDDWIVDHFSGRLQIQEELVQQIGQFIMEHTKPQGVAIRISAVHICKTHRDIRASHRGWTVTSTYFGALRDDQPLKEEFLRECLALERAP